MKNFWILLCLIVVSCSSTEDKKDDASQVEAMPKVDMKRFHKVKSGKVEGIMLEDLTSATSSSDNVLFDYNSLFLEQHIRIERHSISTFKKSLKARDLTPNRDFYWFAEETMDDFQNQLRFSEISKLKYNHVNGIECGRSEFRGTSYGFPKEKVFWFRFYKGKKYYYTLTAWTTYDSKAKFEKEVLAMALSLKLN